MTNPWTRLLAAACLVAAAATAQTAQSTSSSSSSSSSSSQQQEPAVFLEEKERRFHVGVRARFIPLNLMRKGEVTTITESPAIEWQTQLDRKVPILGYGVTAEFQVTTSFGVAADLLFHQVRYEMLNNIRTGVRNPNTSVDTRPVTQFREKTRAQFFDLPIIVRWRPTDEYGDPSRWFLGLGPTVRQTRNVRTFYDQSQPRVDNPVTEGVAPFNKHIYGATVAAGITAKDDFGIRITPEVRYTRWVGQSFSNFAARTNRHQLQVLIGITF
jgi:hypothetical protein